MLSWLVVGLAAAGAGSYFGAGPSASFLALATVYLWYVVGALLIKPASCTSWSLSAVRLVSGLLLTTVFFFFSLTLSLPWLCGPATLLVLVLVVERRSAFGPLPAMSASWSDGIAVGFGLLLFAPR